MIKYVQLYHNLSLPFGFRLCVWMVGLGDSARNQCWIADM